VTVCISVTFAECALNIKVFALRPALALNIKTANILSLYEQLDFDNVRNKKKIGRMAF
jgi:hypothetical protein